MIPLFVSTKDIKRYNPIDGSVDPDKFLTYIEDAQDIHIQNYLGTKLYQRLLDGIVSDDLNADELTLIDDYIVKAMIYLAAADYMPFAPYTIANGGMFKHTPENAIPMDKSDVDYLTKKTKSKAEYYIQRLVDYLCHNSSKYPEYTQNTEADVYPDRRTNSSSNLYLRDVSGGKYDWRTHD